MTTLNLDLLQELMWWRDLGGCWLLPSAWTPRPESFSLCLELAVRRRRKRSRKVSRHVVQLCIRKPSQNHPDFPFKYPWAIVFSSNPLRGKKHFSDISFSLLFAHPRTHYTNLTTRIKHHKRCLKTRSRWRMSEEISNVPILV